jgi:hypothetical protein
MFNSQLVAAFRQWKLRVEENVANREMVSKMITKWRKQDIMRSLYQWQRNAQVSKQERTDGGAWRMLLAPPRHVIQP